MWILEGGLHDDESPKGMGKTRSKEVEVGENEKAKVDNGETLSTLPLIKITPQSPQQLRREKMTVKFQKFVKIVK